jgi:hypothetical protein
LTETSLDAAQNNPGFVAMNPWITLINFVDFSLCRLVFNTKNPYLKIVAVIFVVLLISLRSSFFALLTVLDKNLPVNCKKKWAFSLTSVEMCSYSV